MYSTVKLFPRMSIRGKDLNKRNHHKMAVCFVWNKNDILQIRLDVIQTSILGPFILEKRLKFVNHRHSKWKRLSL